MIKTDENRSYFIKAYIALEPQNSNTERLALVVDKRAYTIV